MIQSNNSLDEQYLQQSHRKKKNNDESTKQQQNVWFSPYVNKNNIKQDNEILSLQKETPLKNDRIKHDSSFNHNINNKQDQQKQQFQKNESEEQLLHDFTNSYLNDIIKIQQPQRTTINNNGRISQQSNKKDSQNSSLLQSSSKRNTFLKQCSSNYVSTDLQSSFAHDEQNGFSHHHNNNESYSPSAIDKITEVQSHFDTSIQMMRNSSKSNYNYNNTTYNSYKTQSPLPKDQSSFKTQSRPGSSAKQYKNNHNHTSSYNQYQQQSPLRISQKYSPSASQNMPLSNTEIVGSLSCSTILNKSTSTTLHKKYNNSINNSQNLMNQSTQMNQSQQLRGLEDIMKKSTINRLGLSLKPVCSQHKHKQLKYICVDEKCIENERVLCDLCKDEFGHQFHDIKTIEEYNLLIESSYDTFLRKYYHFKTIKEELEHPPFLANLNSAINKIKDQVCQQLDQIKDNINQAYTSMLKTTDEDNLSNGNNNSNKNNNSQYNNKQSQQYQIIRSSNGYLNQLNQSRNSSRNGIRQSQPSSMQQSMTNSISMSQSMTQNLSNNNNNYNKFKYNEIEEEMNNMSEIGKFLQEIVQKNFYDLKKKEMNVCLALINKEHFIRLEDLHNTIKSRYTEMESIFMNKVMNITDKINEQIQIVLNKYTNNNSNNNSFKFKFHSTEQEQKQEYNELELRQQELEKEIKNKREELKQLKKDQEIFKNTYGKNNKRLNLESQFGYNLYKENCIHLLEQNIITNTIPIFNCCQQAYQCIQCHYIYCKHQPVVTNPSKRYCMKCLTVFKVKFPTNVHINCDDCISKQS